ncbi:hypothetical protein TIFTF001_018745 [Ficus carica]|uniref:Uncharacterized protein n=1 Tax=Ficus carica TaxID=3494 RepID=A0AA88D9J3_FICCA|nr:hypothetical protein TIFTF001_018745 [Ficus carica]
MPKIFGTTPDVIAWSDRSCTVTLRQVICKREAPQSDGNTGGVSVIGSLMLKSVTVTQGLDLAAGGVNFIYRNDGGYDSWLGRLATHLVHNPHIAFPSLFLVPSEDPDAIRGGELHGQVTDGRSTTKNSTIRVALLEPSPTVTGRQIMPTARTHSPTNPHNGVRAGDTADDVVCYSDFSDQRVIVRVEKFVDLIVSEGDRSTVLAADLRDAFRHVYIFSPSNLPGLADISSPATRGVANGNSSKDGVDNVLGLRNSRPVAVSDQQFDLVPQLYAILHLVADVFVEIAILVLVSFHAVHSERRWIPKYPPAGNLIQEVLSGGDKGSILMKPPGRSFWPRRSRDCSPGDCLNQPSILNAFLESLDYGVVGTTLYFHDSFIKRSRYSFSDSPSPCLILNRYEVSIFRVFVPRNAAAKALASCLNESTDPGISLRYHCRVALVKVKENALQRAASLAFWMSMWYNLFWSSISAGLSIERSRPRCWVIPAFPRRSNTEVVLPRKFTVSLRHCPGSNLLGAAGDVATLGRAILLSRLLENSLPGRYSWSRCWSLTFLPLVRLLLQLAAGDRLRSLPFDLGCLIGVNFAAFSNGWWSLIFCDSRNASMSTRTVSVKLWTFPMRIFICVAGQSRVVKALDVLAGSLVHSFIAVTYKMEAPQSDGDTGGVSATGTPMHVLLGLGCLGDPIGLNSECSRRGTAVSPDGGRCDADSEGPTELEALKSCPERYARANGTSPGHDLSKVHGVHQQW